MTQGSDSTSTNEQESGLQLPAQRVENARREIRFVNSFLLVIMAFTLVSFIVLMSYFTNQRNSFVERSPNQPTAPTVEFVSPKLDNS